MTSSKDAQYIRLSDGRILGYALYGDPKGKPVFYFHGWPGSRLRAAVIDLAARQTGVFLVSPDRPGYGLSTYKKKRKLLDWPSDVLALADALNIKKFAVVGVSGGGPYAAVCAYKISHRVTKTGIVVGLAPPYIHKILGNMNFFTRLGFLTYAKFPILAFLGAWYQKILTQHFSRFTTLNYPAKVDKQVITSLKVEMEANDREAFRQGVNGPAGDLVLYSDDWGFEINDIRGKVFLWYGEDDKNVSLAMGRYYAETIPKSELIVYPHEGHLISVTRAKEIFNKLVV